MRSAIALSLLASTAIAFLLAGSFIARADETKRTEADKPDKSEPDLKTDKLGKDWEKLRDSLDEAFEHMQTDAGVKPAAIADDDTWLRRVFLDLTGAPPSPEEIKQFKPGDKDPGSRATQRKRQAIVERLIESQEFTEHFSTWLSTVIVGRDAAPTLGARRPNQSVYAYLNLALEQDTPWDKTVYGMFAGDTVNQSYMQYMISSNDLGYVAGNTARVFLGRQIQCAQCHDSKVDDTTQSDFEAWQAFFKSFIREYVEEGETKLVMDDDIRYSTIGDLQKKLNLKGDHKLPRFLNGQEWTTRDGRNLREAMAGWLTGENNPWFAEMTVNRIMAFFLGVGFVNPVDDFNALNEPTIPLILKVMGMDFAASKYDLRYLVKAIVNSRIYQRESTTNYSNFEDRVFYSHQHVRELTPEMVTQSILKVQGLPRLTSAQIQQPPAPPFGGGGGGGGGGGARPAVPVDPNAPESLSSYQFRLQTLIDSAWDGDDISKTVDERGGNVARALMFMNGDILPKGIETSLTKLLETPMSSKARVKELFTTVMGRRPTDSEVETMTEMVKEWSDGKLTEQEIYEDLFIGLMCTPEFINRA